MNKIVQFFVPGIPRPGGSKTPRINQRTGKQYCVDACKYNKTWRQDVQLFARQAYHDEPFTGAVRCDIVFYMPRPKSHYRKNNPMLGLKKYISVFHIIRPDFGKLERSTLDALTGIIWRDDAQVCQRRVGDKLYAFNKVGAAITIEFLGQA